MRHFTKLINTVLSRIVASLRGVAAKFTGSRSTPEAPATPTPSGRRRGLRGVHFVPLVAVLALGATAFAVNTGATPESDQIAVGEQVPHSTPSMTAEAAAKKAAAKEAAAKEAKKKADLAKWEKAKKEAELEVWNAAVEKAEAAQAQAAEQAAAAEQRAAAAQTQTQTQPQPQSQPVSASGACGGSLPPCCVMMRESGGNPTVVNSSSGAAGKWQFMTSTWAGYGGYATAAQAPEHVQDAKAAELWAGGAGAGHWGGGC